MMYFETNDGYTIRWHTGEDKPDLWQPKDPLLPRRFIKEVQADGDELEFIRINFDNIPIPKLGHKRVVIWTGDMAMFIYNNL